MGHSATFLPHHPRPILPAMPYQWSPSPEPHLRLWPYRSLSPRGFVWFIGTTAALIALPLITLIGQPVWWGLLPFIGAALAAIWFALNRNTRDAAILEELHLTPTRITLTRHAPRSAPQQWEANPHWVQLHLYPTEGPVPQYLTLRGNGREVELGSFLSEEERVTLRQELHKALTEIRHP
ncbi:MAG: DUF2244 domain-containing protein [Paracoccaceae bacterium]